MKDSTRKRLKESVEETLAFWDAQYKAANVPKATVDELVGEDYVRRLNELGETGAIEYLTFVPEEEIVKAYAVLWRRLSPPALVQVCLHYLTRATFWALMKGAGDLGPLLLGTHDKQASGALARVIRNPAVDERIRQSAYESLVDINSSADLDDVLDRSRVRHDAMLSGQRVEIDWEFVNSFVESWADQRGQD